MPDVPRVLVTHTYVDSPRPVHLELADIRCENWEKHPILEKLRKTTAIHMVDVPFRLMANRVRLYSPGENLYFNLVKDEAVLVEKRESGSFVGSAMRAIREMVYELEEGE